MSQLAAIAGVVALALGMAVVVRIRQGWRPLGFLTWLWPWDAPPWPVVKRRAKYSGSMPPAETIHAASETDTGVDDPHLVDGYVHEHGPAAFNWLLDLAIERAYDARSVHERMLDDRDSARIWAGIHELITHPAPRPFLLVRREDLTGVSGTGIVAEGALFSTGKAVLAWVTDKRSVAVYDSIDDLEAIHGHDGRTRVTWLDAA